MRDLIGGKPPGGSFTFPCAARLLLATAFLCAALWPVYIRADGLPQSVRDVLDEAGIPYESVGVYVQDVADSAPLIDFKADDAKNPASVMKLVTTAAALHALGPDYRWYTVAYAGGPLNGERLEGDLILKGFGDPLMDTEAFWKFLRRLRERGLRHVTGDLVIDESFFKVQPEDRGAFDGRPYRVYNVQPAALLVNFQVYRFRLWPDRSRGEVVVSTDPPSATMTIHNRMKLTNGRCRGRKYRVRMQVLEGLPLDTVRFTGNYPSSCGAHSMLRTVSTQESYVYGVFKALWTNLGGEIDGGVRTDVVPDSARRLFRFQSRPLADIIRPMNKFSNNVMTRNLLLTLGAERYGEPGTVEKGRAAIRDWLQRTGIDTESLVVDNGSGLSRDARASSRLLGELLLEAYRSPYMPEFIASLPLSAMEGTMESRFRDNPLKGRMHMKTGLIDHVRSMGGFMLSRNGRTFVIVLLQNHVNVHRRIGTQIQDALLQWVFEQ
ncbi:MAG: D-alanyl-D-alanine carboxypeptidase/D-alanyl-D-alanine-endopeptidase [Gammaproteobacteria bacterium]|nr:D-alanyl-D-alanine carboxypeptidase/D-alanyl-D-alanine-endopeptidase [Gammaproteobacteria bacterium]